MVPVPNMNKINPFISAILQQMHNMYENVAIITLMLFYKHEQHMGPDNGTKYEQNHQILL